MHGKECLEVAEEVARRIDDEPGPAGDFMKSYTTVVDEYPICPLSGYATIKYAPQIGLVSILSVM